MTAVTVVVTIVVAIVLTVLVVTWRTKTFVEHPESILAKGLMGLIGALVVSLTLPEFSGTGQLQVGEEGQSVFLSVPDLQLTSGPGWPTALMGIGIMALTIVLLMWIRAYGSR